MSKPYLRRDMDGKLIWIFFGTRSFMEKMDRCPKRFTDNVAYESNKYVEIIVYVLFCDELLS